MARVNTVSASPPSNGITRDCDLTIDSSIGNRVDGSVDCVRNLRTGVEGGPNGISVSASGAAFSTPSGSLGRSVVGVSSGLGNGVAIQYSIPVQTVLGATATVAFSLRRGVSRVVATLFQTDTPSPNNDVGMQCVIGGSALSELLPASGGGKGKIGFGLWQLAGQNGYSWAMKTASDGAGDLSDVTLINNALATVAHQYELRIFDVQSSSPTVSGFFPRVELWVDNKLFLTRYWTNPTGISTALLPPTTPAGCGSFIPQIRNTSTGPATFYAGDFSLIHGPNNEGTI